MKRRRVSQNSTYSRIFFSKSFKLFKQNAESLICVNVETIEWSVKTANHEEKFIKIHSQQ